MSLDCFKRNIPLKDHIPHMLPNSEFMRINFSLQLFPISVFVRVSTVTSVCMLSEHCTEDAGRRNDCEDETSKRLMHVSMDL